MWEILHLLYTKHKMKKDYIDVESFPLKHIIQVTNKIKYNLTWSISCILSPSSKQKRLPLMMRAAYP